jgi:hypothetical protein
MTLKDIHTQLTDTVFEPLENYITKTNEPAEILLVVRDRLSKLLDILQEKSYEKTFTIEEIYKIIDNVFHPKE